MEASEYITGLQSKLVERLNLDCDGEFGHMVKEYSLKLPGGATCKGFICSDEYRDSNKEENKRRINDMWKLAMSIHCRARTASEPSRENHI